MRYYFKNYARFMCSMIVSALILSGFSSIAHVTFLNSPSETSPHLTINEPASERDVDISENHSHHSNGEEECHSVSCNAYFTSVHPQLHTPFLKIVAFTVSTDQSVKSLSAVLYRPPKSIL